MLRNFFDGIKVSIVRLTLNDIDLYYNHIITLNVLIILGFSKGKLTLVALDVQT